MTMLAIETSQREGGIALRRGDGTVVVESLRGARRHDDDLMPAIDRIVRGAGLVPADLEAIAVSVGPGGFTGLRIAIATAKMLGLALGCRIVAVPGAAVVAESIPVASVAGPLLVVLGVKGARAWGTTLEVAAGAWEVRQAGPIDATTLDVAPFAAVAGDDYLPETIRDRARSVIAARFDPAACLAAGWRMHRSGRHVAAARLAPIYGREPEAVAIWDARTGGADRADR